MSTQMKVSSDSDVSPLHGLRRPDARSNARAADSCDCSMPLTNCRVPESRRFGSELQVSGRYAMKSIRRITLSSICLGLMGLLLTNHGLAAPSIASVSGTFSQDQTLAISGSSFGTKSKATPVLWDTVDNIPSYNTLADGAVIPVGGTNPWPSPYGNSSGTNAVNYNKSDPQRGVSTAQYKASNKSGAYLDGLTWPKTNQTYVSWWWKTNTDVSGGNHSSKFLRMSDSNDETGKTSSWTQMQFIIWSNPNYNANDWPSWNGNPNKWNFLESWFDSVKQSYVIRVNGQTLDSGTWSGSAIQFNELWKIGFDGGGNSPPAITWWMDNIYVDDTLSRVMVGNASAWSACTQFEMQFPVAWSGSSIQVRANVGGLSPNQQAFLYVVDSTGAVNSNGYLITVGGSASAPASTSLVAPGNLHLQ